MVLLVATLLPLLIYALISTGISYRDDRRVTEAATLALAVRISDAVDARLEGVSAMVQAMATVRSIGERDWSEARQRAAEIAKLDPDWRDVSLIDLGTGQAVFSLGETKIGPCQTVRVAPERLRAASASPQFDGILPNANASPEIIASMRVGETSSPGYLLCVSLDPQLVQRILLSLAPKEGVSAVVDRDGLFIARTKSLSSRMGTPATHYVRQAIASGRSGLYRGVTYEGLENYTGFFTSVRTGWSAHIAVSSKLLDGPRYGWRLAAILAGLMAVLLALILVLFILRLVTAQQAAEERARQAERLEAVGKLTGGIAHDFNNMLAIVIGSLDLGQRRLANGNADITRYIDNAMDGATRAADLTRRLLAFSRSQPLAPATVNVNALIRSTGELLRRTLPSNIDIQFDFEPELWPTFVDTGELENALVNLAVNARDAMPDGGRLIIATENRALPASRDEMVAILVKDSGAGMAPGVAERAFEPFYTTKAVGRGTGLGLSQIHGFVTQSGGDVTIASKAGDGTVVTILLPRYTGSESATVEAVRSAGQTAPGGCADEILLVVEDEEQVRKTNVEALRSLGYTVRHAADAQEALKILETQSGVRLMLTDVLMPGMSGRDLATQVARSYPEIRILLATGYDREPAEVDEWRVLRKPFGISELAHQVRRELNLAA